MKVITIELREMDEHFMDCTLMHVASSWEKAEEYMELAKDCQDRGAPWWWWCSEEIVDDPDVLGGDQRIYSWDGEQIDYQPIDGYNKTNEKDT